MGNRAVITASNAADVAQSKDIGLYLHWNGGRDSVTAFLTYCKAKGYRAPDMDNYGWARLAQVVGNFFGGELSVGIDTCDRLDCDNFDNGVYIIKGWEIVGRQYHHGGEQSGYDLLGMLEAINEAQPQKEQLTQEQLEAAAYAALNKA